MKGMTKALFIEKASAFYNKMRDELDDTEQHFYEYEEKFDELMTRFCNELLGKGLGSVPVDARKKKARCQPVRLFIFANFTIIYQNSNY